MEETGYNSLTIETVILTNAGTELGCGGGRLGASGNSNARGILSVWQIKASFTKEVTIWVLQSEQGFVRQIRRRETFHAKGPIWAFKGKVTEVRKSVQNPWEEGVNQHGWTSGGGGVRNVKAGELRRSQTTKGLVC